MDEEWLEIEGEEMSHAGSSGKLFVADDVDAPSQRWGERALFAAILHSALMDLEKDHVIDKSSWLKSGCVTNQVSLRSIALQWFRGDCESTVTLRECCEILDLDVELIRDYALASPPPKRLLRPAKKETAKVRHALGLTSPPIPRVVK